MKDLRAFLTLIMFFALSSVVNGQSIDEDISRLLELSGSSSTYEETITQLLDYFRTSMPGNNEFLDEFEKEALSIGLKSLEEKLIPIYKDVYSGAEIKKLIELYESEVGILLVSKQAELSTKSLEVGRIWGEEMASKVIDRINNVDSSERVGGYGNNNTVFGRIQLLENGHNKLTIDEEHNVGKLLLDFGNTSNQETSLRGVRVKNISSDTVIMQQPFFVIDGLEVDFDNEVLLPGEEGEILFVWNTSCLEGSNYSNLFFSTDKGDSFSIGVKAQASNKTVEYDISNTEVTFRGFLGKYSEEHQFIIKNTGEIDLQISGVSTDNSVAFISLENDDLPIGGEVRIIVVFSKDLLEKYENATVETIIEVELVKCSSENWKTIERMKINE